MIGLVRLYIEPRDYIPDSMKPVTGDPVIDVEPDMVYTMRQELRRQGFEVIAIPI